MQDFCTDISQYSSACACIGFVPSTSTAVAPSTTQTVTAVITPLTYVIISTVATVPVTLNYTTIPVTTTVTTNTISRPIQTITQKIPIATEIITETTSTTETTTTYTTPDAPPPAPTYTAFIQGPGGILVEDINVPPGAHIGVIATIRQTTNPATWVIDGTTNSVTLLQTPPTHVPYRFFYYESAAGYSYVQVTSDLVAGIMGVRLLRCRVAGGLGSGFECYREVG